MGYTPHDYQAGVQNPYNVAFNTALQNYQKLQELKYQPQLYQAEILGKVATPLAQFAASPAGAIWGGAQGDQARNALSAAIQQYQQGQQPHPGLLSGLFGGGQQGQMASPEAQQGPMMTHPQGVDYLSGDDIYDRLSKGAEATFGPGKKTALYKSNLASAAEQHGLPSEISKALGGSDTAAKAYKFEQDLADGIKYLTARGYSEAEARAKLTKGPNELSKDYNARIKPLFKDINKEELPEIPETAIPKGAAVPMYKNGKLHFIPADKVADAKKNWGYTYEK